MTELPQPPDPGPSPEPRLTEAAEPAAAPASFDLPGARRVVGAGIQLAIASAADIRRASLYIGLLALAAFGPAVVFLVAVVDHFDLDLAVVIEDLGTGQGLYFLEHPELVGPLLFLEGLVGIGLIVLVAISIDAQTIGIGLLAGHAATRQIRLPEAITRARQVFWRMVGGALLVGIYSTVIQLFLGFILGAEAGTNPALDFVVAMVATLATVPFAYLAAGIVLGDVGPIEALKRSTGLFRARPSVALVVVLFTLLTSAIETFALGAGLDLVARIGELLGLDATAGGPALVLPIVLSLAAVMAFGSLLFTIAALVSAPQVAAFLGLTFYAGGLDRARAEGNRPPGFRWVTRPMLVAFAGLGVVAMLGISTLAVSPASKISSIGDSALVTFLENAATGANEEATVDGGIYRVDDPPGAQVGEDAPIVDIVSAEYVLLDRVPDWLLDDVFPCGTGTSVCGGPDDERWAYEDGALLFLQRMATAPDVRDRRVNGNWGPLLTLDGFSGMPELAETYLADVSDEFLTRIGGGVATIHHWGTDRERSSYYPTFARSAWIGLDLLTLIPVSEIPAVPVAWDAYAATDSNGRYDSLRAADGGPMPTFRSPATIVFSPSGTTPTP